MSRWLIALFLGMFIIMPPSSMAQNGDWRCSITGLARPLETQPMEYILRAGTDCDTVSPHLKVWNELYQMQMDKLRSRCDSACAIANVEQDHQLLEERCIGDWDVRPTLQRSCTKLTEPSDSNISLGVTIDIRLVLHCHCIAPPLELSTDQG